ncbi:MAG TPA: hypothetical protein VMK16_00380 [Acidimicrobiales bacterium]|nr:hypothetical protein [Acidimicrobiales bacterium]
MPGLLQGHARGTRDLAYLGERHFGPFQGVQELRTFTGPETRPGEPLEIVGFERLNRVGVLQRGPCRRPLAPVVCGSGVVEERFTRHRASLACRAFGTMLSEADDQHRSVAVDTGKLAEKFPALGVAFPR